MKKKNLSLLPTMLFTFIFSLQALSQCGMISLIGEFNGWAGDHNMTRDPENPDLFSSILILTEQDDMSNPPDGIIELKFRENADWAVNWGSTDFPGGIGYLNGPNIPAPVSSYLVTFNCATGEYYFQATCGEISIIGEFSGWAGDHFMDRSSTNPDQWSTILTLTPDDDTNGDGIIELKFRENADWATNWGAQEFPGGIGILNGPNIPVPLDYIGATTDFKVTFNCLTGEYYFQSTSGEISIIGEFGGFWVDDYFMERDDDNPDQWSYLLTLTPADDPNGDGIVEIKFRENAGWQINWGSTGFPGGIGYQNGPNIPVPLDNSGITTDYFVTFNATSGAYYFEAANGPISIIGEFSGWVGGIPMNRDPVNPNLWKVDISLPANFDFSPPPDGIIESKFRENMDWSINWGDDAFPAGTGITNGPNIPVVPGKYSVIFNGSTFDYNFVENPDICGGIGMVGDFNGWGVGTGNVPTDVFLIRDPEYPCLFSIEYNFLSSTGLLFRVDALPINNDNVWGGTFPCETGVHDVSQIIYVPGGSYNITFNALSGDFCFEVLDMLVEAPNVFDMTIDGFLDETEWEINQSVSRFLDGVVWGDLNQAIFGVAYNQDFLYFGIQVTDQATYLEDQCEIFIDGDNSNGNYDSYDLHLRISYDGLFVIQGPNGLGADYGFNYTGLGYTVEVSIPWAPLGITPVEGEVIGFDVFVGDCDTGSGIDYTLAWNGDLQNYDNTSHFGTLVFGSLSIANISLYNETIGDVILRNLTDMPTTFVGTYNMDNNYDVVFRKDQENEMVWGSNTFPLGIAVLGGDPIPATAGRYRITFDCSTGLYTFVEEPASEGVAYAQYTLTTPVIDGDLSEYSLDYNSEILVYGTGPIDNIVSWGTLWDANNLYIGARVIDTPVEGYGNPWDNDGVEMYIDGNHDSDGAYDSDFDTQLILDALNQSTLWIKADGVPVTNYQSIWNYESMGYTIELRLGWDNFNFNPGKGRSIGWSLANNDSDNGIGRDYQSVWYGTEFNWSNTTDFGDLEMADGPYTVINEIEKDEFDVVLFPNPAEKIVHITSASNDFNGDLTIKLSDITGRLIISQKARIVSAEDVLQLNTSKLLPGIYLVSIISDDGKKAIEKLVIQ